ncbi:ribulose-phosphate 3-epimerase [Rothia sp. CCM 9418]|uniref:ribulose-phosphate 3-epimerase n=1 Tax=Rothia sp. CCM 9418 TaxID=3402661 RepID=UPI003AEB1D47
MDCHIHPSILSADFANFERDLQRISSADAVHVDVMDNHFVPNLSWGPAVVKRLREVSPLPFDVHLMIEDADRWAPEYAQMGCESVTFHAEAAQAPIRLARSLRAEGAQTGMALRPATAVEPYLDMLSELDMLLIMTVEPGFGGQAFLEVTLPKIRRAAEAIAGSGAQLRLQVDGGITEETIVRAAEAGADTFVAGSSVFGAEDLSAAISALREKARTV